MKKIFGSIKFLDFFIFSISITTILWFSFFLYKKSFSPPEVVIKSQEREWVYPLNKDKKLTIPGILGNTIISIKNNKVKVLESPCPNKICIAAPSLRKIGDWNGCLPNQVFLYIEGNKEEEASKNEEPLLDAQ